MSVSHAEFVAFKTESMERLRQVEDVVTKTLDDVKKLQEATDLISVQAAPWSASIETAVAASEAKAQSALTEARSLCEGTRVEVEELRRRATDVERKTIPQKGKWEMSRPKGMEPNTFGTKEEQWPKFREDLMDFADAVHPGLRVQLEWTFRQKKKSPQQLWDPILSAVRPRIGSCGSNCTNC